MGMQNRKSKNDYPGIRNGHTIIISQEFLKTKTNNTVWFCVSNDRPISTDLQQHIDLKNWCRILIGIGGSARRSLLAFIIHIFRPTGFIMITCVQSNDAHRPSIKNFV